MLVRQ